MCLGVPSILSALIYTPLDLSPFIFMLGLADFSALLLVSASLVTRNGGDSGRLSMGQSVGRRLPGMNQIQQAVFGDDEESPLQSKRSSTCSLTDPHAPNVC